MKETVFISGLYSGPSPSAGLGVARSLRAAFPSAHLVGVDYWAGSSGLHHEVFDATWRTFALVMSIFVVIFALFVTGYQLRESRHHGRSARPLPPGTAR